MAREYDHLFKLLIIGDSGELNTTHCVDEAWFVLPDIGCGPNEK